MKIDVDTDGVDQLGKEVTRGRRDEAVDDLRPGLGGARGAVVRVDEVLARGRGVVGVDEGSPGGVDGLGQRPSRPRLQRVLSTEVVAGGCSSVVVVARGVVVVACGVVVVARGVVVVAGGVVVVACGVVVVACGVVVVACGVVVVACGVVVVARGVVVVVCGVVVVAVVSSSSLVVVVIA